MTNLAALYNWLCQHPTFPHHWKHNRRMLKLSEIAAIRNDTIKGTSWYTRRKKPMGRPKKQQVFTFSSLFAGGNT